MKNRNLFIDYLRGAATILVTLGHCIQYGNGLAFVENQTFFNDIIFSLIYSFHMPLFMLISGYLFSYSGNQSISIWKFLKKKSCRLLLPILGWELFNSGYPLMISVYQNHSWKYMINAVLMFGREFLEELWFLWAVFYCSLIVYAVRRWFLDLNIIYFIGWLLTFLIPDVIPNMSCYKFMYPFFVAGYIFKERNIFERITPIISKINCKAIIGFTYLALFLFWGYDSYIYTSGYTSLFLDDYWIHVGIDIYRMIIGFCGSVLFIFIIKKMFAYNVLKRTNIILGEESLGIYIISGQMIQRFFVPNLEMFSKNYLLNVGQTVLVLFASFLIVRFIKKIPGIRVILLGGA